ncbi:MAG TPA: 2Fe-2S iron-sulfur cluster-binding protein, partial [Polyangiaceae bacterium]
MSGERLLGSGYRLPPQPREWIDRDAPLDFHFEGSAYSGFSGDTITSALAAHGVRMLGRSFKYHRPRGVYSLANHDVNALMQDAQRLNIRADVTPVWQGADLYAVNTLGGLNADRYRVMDRLSAFFPVGFYYKTFHKPRWLFPFWERRLRNAAGLGKVDLKHPRVRTPKDYAFCDVLVIGGGPAGLSAALSAAKASARVMLVDENPRLGGSLTYQYGGKSDALSLAEPLLSQVQSEKGIEVRLSTVAAGYYADHWIALVDDRRLTKLRARSVIVASGCFEIPAVFRNNDLPGVMLASAAQRLIFRFAVKPCHRALVLAANAEGYQACLDLMRAGVEVAGLADLRAEGEPSALGTEVAEAGVPIYAGYAVREARPASGKRGIRGALICPWDGAGNTDTRKAVELRCDGIAMSVGYAAADSLICQSGGKMAYSTPLEQFVPQALPPGVFCAGRVNGVHQLDAQI